MAPVFTSLLVKLRNFEKIVNKTCRQSTTNKNWLTKLTREWGIRAYPIRRDSLDVLSKLDPNVVDELPET